MSGVLLSVAFYAILRVKAIADPALGTGYCRTLLAILAVASLLLAASLLIGQRDYKRMLAYSSIEHMGLLALGAAAGGPLAIGRGAAAHARPRPGQGVAVRLRRARCCRPPAPAASTGSTAWPAVSRCWRLRRGGVLALTGFPPFSIFASEIGIARAGFATGLGWVTALAWP